MCDDVWLQVGAGLSLATLDISHTGLGASALGEFVRRLGAGAMSLRELRLAGESDEH